MEGLAGYVATGVVSLAVGVLLMYLQPKAKLFYWSPHSFFFNLTRENVALQTDALTVQNLGRKEAENVEIILSEEPDFYKLAPAVSSTTGTLEDGHFVIRIPSLGPKEHVTLQLLSYTKVPQLQNLRSSAGQAVPMPILIQRAFPTWVYVAVGIVMLAGFGFLLYWLLLAIIFISKGIGIS